MLINAHTHHISQNPLIVRDIYNQYPWNFVANEAYYSIGIHPILINESNIERDLLTIEKHLSNEKCLAIGEIGLDKITPINFDLQISVFKAQLKIAELHQIPVIIHCVRAYQEILSIRKELKLSIPFIFHGFNKNEHLAQQIISNNCLLSFGKNLLQNPNLQTIFANLSDENFFLENDDSQISIEEIYSKAAEIRNTSVDNIENIIQENFKRIFNK
ncbi:TatD family hydrolase [Faecalibacter bovis]|uniref:TatD family hydrolase n=1 Tax=Faecalibacter bovis TaxID=2898187 RepID=A0ABX7X9X9_9FLAO|nr:TatD family hydrolase [Faecalibacter bovis]QTV04691.1 TatD family hydrolase [Faecalibacter bovis]